MTVTDRSHDESVEGKQRDAERGLRTHADGRVTGVTAHFKASGRTPPLICEASLKENYLLNKLDGN